MTPLDPTYGPTFRPRDRLAEVDLTEWAQAPLFALVRHFRQLHRLYGVADGLQVEVMPPAASNERGDWQIKVRKGTAYDAYGRPLRLPSGTDPVVVNRPDAAPGGTATHVLLLRAGEPPEGPLDRRVPYPPAQWAGVAVVPIGEKVRPWEVPLAGLVWGKKRGEDLPLWADGSYRANASRAFRQPYLGAGVLPAGSTAVALPETAGWRVWVDTSAAGFLPAPTADKADGSEGIAGDCVDPPVYLVTVGRPDWSDAARLLGGMTVLDPDAETVLEAHAAEAPPLVYVSGACYDGFLLTVHYWRSVEAFQATPLQVSWVGVEQIEYRQRGDRENVRTEGVPVDQTTTDYPPLRWPRFHDGGVLTADALNEQQDTLRRLLRLHNSTLHDWGVAEGLAVSALPDKRGVRVSDGYAIDDEGRELIVSSAQDLPNPARAAQPGQETAQQWWVTVCYRDGPPPAEDETSCRREAVPIRSWPGAAVRWRDPRATDAEQLQPGQDLILATVTIEQGKVTAISDAGRRSAVPSQRPYVYAGRQKIGEAVWERWPKTGNAQGIKVTVNTEAAEFVNVPQYFITVELKDPDGGGLAHPALLVEVGNTFFSVILPRDAPQADGGTPAAAPAPRSLVDRLLGRRPEAPREPPPAAPGTAPPGGAPRDPDQPRGEGQAGDKLPEITIAWVGIEV
jgi:hypothetical protein